MNRRGVNRSTERTALQQKHLNARVSYERKCHTPSIQAHKKSKSRTKDADKSKPKDADKKPHKPARNPDHPHSRNSEYQLGAVPGSTKKESPFKHKNRPLSNLNNMRHARNLEHQLSNLNESAPYDSLLEESGRRARGESVTQKSIVEGKKLMKNNQFEKGLAVFAECTQRDPSSHEAQYLLGVCAFHLQHYEQAVHHFSLLLEQEPLFRKNAYLFLAISLKKGQQHEHALHRLTQALEHYPKYFDALVLRAKILSKLHRFYDALQDLNKSLKIEPSNPQSLVAKADCLRALNQFGEAVRIYSGLLEGEWDPEVLLKRAIAHIENNCPNQALLDLNRLIQRTPNNSEAYLFKGVAFAKMKNFNEAILAYEQAIKFNSSRKATTKALYEVSKLKIEVGDYYGASYTLERAGSLDVDLKVIEKLKVFTEGATSIMKKKYRRGIESMNYLAKKEHLNEQIRPLIYSFRAYAHFCQCRFLNALNDLAALQRLGFSCDSASQYNLHLLTGISHAQNNDFGLALASFATARLLRKDFSDPLVYSCLTRVAEYNRNPKTKDPKLLEEAHALIQQALQQEDHSNSHYLCAALLYALGRFEPALEHLEKAIQKSDDHVLKHFYLRGLIHGVTGNTKEAFIDFSNVLTLGKDLRDKPESEDQEKEKEILEAYLNRAKCHLLFEDKKKAFQDLQTYISYKPLDSDIHTVAGRLLFSIGACEDAVKAYNYSPNIDKKKDELLERAKCYLALKQLNLCLKDLQKLIELGDSLARYDYCCLSALKEASKGTADHYKEALRKISPAEGFSPQKGHVFTLADLCFYKGAFSLYLGQLTDARRCFLKAKNIKTVNKELEHLEQQDPDKFTPELFENKIFTDAEIDYDIALTDLLLGDLDQARRVLERYESFGLVFGGEQPKEPIDLTPFPSSNRLCSIFSEIKYPLNDLVRFRISFCLPCVRPPEIRFEVEPKIVEELGMSSTEPRPDAPWIKRNVFGVVFTEEMVGVDIDIKTEKSLKKFEEIKIELAQESPPPADKNSLKDMFFLDAQVENKLARLMQKHKHS